MHVIWIYIFWLVFLFFFVNRFYVCVFQVYGCNMSISIDSFKYECDWTAVCSFNSLGFLLLMLSGSHEILLQFGSRSHFQFCLSLSFLHWKPKKKQKNSVIADWCYVAVSAHLFMGLCLGCYRVILCGGLRYFRYVKIKVHATPHLSWKYKLNYLPF